MYHVIIADNQGNIAHDNECVTQGELHAWFSYFYAGLEEFGQITVVKV